ncbi:hypothetical protein KCP73_11160 [Salmonella enterica subsp. enterica]|nr:hypothetical protein KCP73_11160 [Salmonella enterica subsp. enterica]
MVHKTELRRQLYRVNDALVPRRLLRRGEKLIAERLGIDAYSLLKIYFPAGYSPAHHGIFIFLTLRVLTLVPCQPSFHQSVHRS